MSFFKIDWDLEDYPIRFRHQTGDDTGRLKLIPWVAQIERWPQMQGYGNSRRAALDDLRHNFQVSCAEGRRPRPGTGLPLEFASTRYIDAYGNIARDVLHRLYEIDYDSCFISDESSLFDFEHGDTLDESFAKIRDLYGVDVSNIKSGNLVDVFERIRTGGRVI